MSDRESACNGNGTTHILYLDLSFFSRWSPWWRAERSKLGLQTYGYWHSQGSALHPSTSRVHPSVCWSFLHPFQHLDSWGVESTVIMNVILLYVQIRLLLWCDMNILLRMFQWDLLWTGVVQIESKWPAGFYVLSLVYNTCQLISDRAYN